MASKAPVIAGCALPAYFLTILYSTSSKPLFLSPGVGDRPRRGQVRGPRGGSRRDSYGEKGTQRKFTRENHACARRRAQGQIENMIARAWTARVLPLFHRCANCYDAQQPGK